MSEQKIFRCQHCGNMVGMIHSAGVPMVCCGEPMQELVPNTTEGAIEKHIPVVHVKERLVHVTVGSVAHPMIEAHHIEWIYLESKMGGQMKRLCVGAEAVAMFAVLDDSPIAAYAYCNLHGLWKVEICAECTHPETKQRANGDDKEIVCSPEFSEGCK